MSSRLFNFNFRYSAEFNKILTDFNSFNDLVMADSRGRPLGEGCKPNRLTIALSVNSEAFLDVAEGLGVFYYSDWAQKLQE